MGGNMGCANVSALAFVVAMIIIMASILVSTGASEPPPDTRLVELVPTNNQRAYDAMQSAKDGAISETPSAGGVALLVFIGLIAMAINMRFDRETGSNGVGVATILVVAMVILVIAAVLAG